VAEFPPTCLVVPINSLVLLEANCAVWLCRARTMHPYFSAAFGQKYRMHPLAAALARQQLKKLDSQSEVTARNIRAMNDRLTQLPGLTEPRCRPDQKRAYYNTSMLFVDFKKVGFSRDQLVKALKAEGVSVSFWDYPVQHKLKIYSEAKWWHHPPKIPSSMPGNAYVNANHIMLPLIHGDAPELTEQYVKAYSRKSGRTRTTWRSRNCTEILPTPVRASNADRRFRFP